jgi:hypothetical protein
MLSEIPLVNKKATQIERSQCQFEMLEHKHTEGTDGASEPLLEIKKYKGTHVFLNRVCSPMQI